MIAEEQVYAALRECYDPEIPVNIVDLGLIYEVKVQEDHVDVVMTLTARACPAHTYIREQVRTRITAIPGVRTVMVQVVWDPPWDPSRITRAARQQLGII
jgi:metal-sulfur cluster biosynthetic enzyme